MISRLATAGTAPEDGRPAALLRQRMIGGQILAGPGVFEVQSTAGSGQNGSEGGSPSGSRPVAHR